MLRTGRTVAAPLYQEPDQETPAQLEKCSRGRAGVKQEHNDSGGKMLEMLKKEYQEMTFKDHQCRIEGAKIRKGISYIQKVKGSDPPKWQHETPCYKACTKNYYDLS